jgi:hypothetical protein
MVHSLRHFSETLGYRRARADLDFDDDGLGGTPRNQVRLKRPQELRHARTPGDHVNIVATSPIVFGDLRNHLRLEGLWRHGSSS